jgi:hypothetical protein
MNEIRKAGKVMGAERIAVMAALNVAHELRVKPAGFDMGRQKPIVAIESQLDAAIAKQEIVLKDSVPAVRRAQFWADGTRVADLGHCCDRPLLHAGRTYGDHATTLQSRGSGPSRHSGNASFASTAIPGGSIGS